MEKRRVKRRDDIIIARFADYFDICPTRLDAREKVDKFPIVIDMNGLFRHAYTGVGAEYDLSREFADRDNVR